MGAPITIKKRKVSVKKSATPVVPAAPDQPAEGGDDAAPEAAEEQPEPHVLLSKPKPTKGKKGGTSSSATAVAAVLALIAVLLFLFILLIQWTEYSELNPLFPKPIPIGMITALSPW